MAKRKASLPFLHNPMDDVNTDEQLQFDFTDDRLLEITDQTLREVSSILKGRYPNGKSAV
jgi:hypothetical protein